VKRRNKRRNASQNPGSPALWRQILRSSHPVASTSQSNRKKQPRESKGVVFKPLDYKYLFVVFMCLVCVAGAYVYHLNVRLEGAKLEREVRRQTAVREKLLFEHNQLRLEIASLKSPARIEHEARERLGMEMPEHDRIVSLNDRKRQRPVSGRAL